MADLKQFSKNFRKDLNDPAQPVPQDPSTFAKIMSLINPAPAAQASPVQLPPEPEQVPNITGDNYGNFFDKMKKR